MSGAKDFWLFEDDFTGDALDTNKWTAIDMSSAGTPTAAIVDGSRSGEYEMKCSATDEIQRVGIYQADKLQFDIDVITEVVFILKQTSATKDATTDIAFGLIGDVNANIDSIAQSLLFRLPRGAASNLIYVESDDGTNENAAASSGQSLGTSHVKCVFNFATGTADIRAFVAGQPVLTGTTFNMSAYTGQLQLFAIVHKAADTNTDGIRLDYVGIRGRRA